MAERPIEEIAEEVLRLDAEATPGPWRAGAVERSNIYAIDEKLPWSPPEFVCAQTNNRSENGRWQADAALIATFRAAAPELAREVQRRIHLRTMKDRCADALADEVAVLVRRGVIDSRSPAADALLDLRNPPSSPRADRLAKLEREVESLREERDRLRTSLDGAEVLCNALKAQAADRDVPYRPGLPSVEQVRAHEARGSLWMRWSGGMPVIEILEAVGDAVTDADGEPFPEGSSWCPCLPNGKPCPWIDP